MLSRLLLHYQCTGSCCKPSKVTETHLCASASDFQWKVLAQEKIKNVEGGEKAKVCCCCVPVTERAAQAGNSVGCGRVLQSHF